MAIDMPREVELKLRTTAEAIGQLKLAELLAGHLRTAPRTSRLSSVYFDTPDHRLAAQRMALRVRKIGRRHVQTLKGEAAPSGAAADRPEWEMPVAGPLPELGALPEQARARSGLDDEEALVPLFVTRFKRQSALVAWVDADGAPALVELAVDQGGIECGPHHETIGELELELKEGAASALFGLAAWLRGTLPLAIETQAKGQRGFAMATNAAPLAFRPGKLDLEPDLTVEDGLEAILRHGLVQWMRNEPAARDGREPDGVHQMRVALRRLRTALGLFKSVLTPAMHERWDGELRWLLGELGPARDLDVFSGEVVAPVAAAEGTGALLDGLEAAIGARRAAAHAALRACLASRRYADLLFELASWIEGRGWREGVEVELRLAQQEPLRVFAQAELDRRWRKVRKAGRGFAGLSPEERHALRVRVKKLRYGVDFFASLFDGKKPRRFARRLAALQEALGHMNDLAVAGRLATEAMELPGEPEARERTALGAGVVIGWHGARHQKLEPGMVACWKAFKKRRRFWKQAGR